MTVCTFIAAQTFRHKYKHSHKNKQKKTIFFYTRSYKKRNEGNKSGFLEYCTKSGFSTNICSYNKYTRSAPPLSDTLLFNIQFVCELFHNHFLATNDINTLRQALCGNTGLHIAANLHTGDGIYIHRYILHQFCAVNSQTFASDFTAENQ